MSFTGGNILPNIGKRINWSVVALAGGLAVAISVVAGLSVMEKDTTQAPAAAIPNVSAPPTASTASQTSTRPQVIIVESQVQADALEAEVAADQMAAVMQGYEVPHQQTSMVVIDSPSKQYLYDQVIADQKASDTFDIVDLRASSIPEALPAHSDATLPSSAEARPTLYVVESSEQEASVTAAMDADKLVAVLEGSEVTFQNQFLVVSSPEDENALNEILREQLMLPEPAFEIIDLRN